MKFSWKIFFVTFIIIVAAFGTGGFLLINSVFSTTIQARRDDAQSKNRYITTALSVYADNNLAASEDTVYLRKLAVKFAEQVAESAESKVSIGALEDISYTDDSFVKTMPENSRGSRIVRGSDKYILQTVSKLKLLNRVYYVETIDDLTDVYESRDSYYLIYRMILLGVALSASAVLVAFSKLITRPLEKLTAATGEIAGGRLDMRVDERGGITSSSEIRELSQSFNRMADRVEENIEELKDEAKRRDVFIADFTHELKTPLTSVIGYADMLRSYELSPEKRRECAQQIYSEGSRLEALSLNLLNIIVLKNNRIERVGANAEALVLEAAKTVRFNLEKRGVRLNVEAESAEIMCEPSLVKTLLINLIDNACKASERGGKVLLSGRTEDGGYRFCVVDRGCGIAPDELKKITRPFYMVDKSRSRSMGGAGLGLSLCAEIARLHGGRLEISSEPGHGTSAEFFLALPDTDCCALTEGEADEY